MKRCRYLLLGIGLMLQACSPIIIDRMPCAGEYYIETDLQRSFSLFYPHILEVETAWADNQGYNLYLLEVIGLYGMELLSEEIEPDYPSLYYDHSKAERSINHSSGNRPALLQIPLQEGIWWDSERVTNLRIGISYLRSSFENQPLEAVAIRTVKMPMNAGGNVFSPTDPDTIRIGRWTSIQLTLTETDPCYDPPRKRCFDRYRETVYVD